MSTAPALSATEAATVARFAAAEHAPESLRWRVAVAINDEGAYCGDCDYEDGLECPECKRACLGYADAAIAALAGPT